MNEVSGHIFKTYTLMKPSDMILSKAQKRDHCKEKPYLGMSAEAI